MDEKSPRRLLLAGDVHGNGRRLGTLCKLARRRRCDAILQLDDFGYWPHTADGHRFLEQVSRHAEHKGIDCVYWIDGNHENHDVLAEFEPDEDGMITVANRCRYVSRGHRWQWSGVRFGTPGGAFSVDRRQRVRHVSWWPGELLTDADADADVEGLGEAPLDVLVTHDTPEGTPVRGLALPAADETLASEVRARVLDAVEVTEPRPVVHGHWHHRYSHELTWSVTVEGDMRWRTTRVEGLAADVQHDHRSWAVLDLDALRFIDSRRASATARENGDARTAER